MYLLYNFSALYQCSFIKIRIQFINVCCSNWVTTKFPEKIRFFIIFFYFWERKLFYFEHFEILTVSLKMKVMALAIIDLSGLMSVNVTCITCKKSVSCRNLNECSLCLTMVHLKKSECCWCRNYKKYWLR